MFPPSTKFLVVDDFASMRRIITKALIELGYNHFEEADDGVSALSMLRKARDEGKPFQFVFSDWNMPKMAGIDLLKACKSEPTLKSIPFVLVTAESEEKNIVEAAKWGVSEYVVKPFDTNTLKEKLEKVFLKTVDKN
jgi:two-component system, chemotaxis family, chemotaxis protein CheY